MSRAFVKEDAGDPERRFVLPKRDDPGYDEAAAWALLEAADDGDSRSAELATGYSWGEPKALRGEPGRVHATGTHFGDDLAGKCLHQGRA